VADWRVFWMPRDAVRSGVRRSVLAGWEDLPAREREVGVRAGDPIFLSPDYRVDMGLCSYGRSKDFRDCTPETRRNYATDIRLLLNFLWGRGLGWTEARERDLEDFEHWRRQEESNPGRIGGTKWDRELAAFLHLYKWAVKNKAMTRNPVATKQVFGRWGEVLTVAEARAKDSRPSNVHWLTPRTWRRWTDIGLRGHTKEGVPESGWVGRTEDRNVAFVKLLVSSGLRRSEGGSQLRFEVPQRRLDGGRYYRGLISAAVTRSKKTRTFYVASEAIGDVEAYVDSSRAWAVRRAQRQGLYEQLPEVRIFTKVTRGLNPTVHWVDRNGVAGEALLNKLPITERALLFAEGPRGPEPLWLWLNEQGLPFHPHSWNGVFRTANQRCEAVLTPPEHLDMDPHKVWAPYATVHSARHSFALYMLVVLDTLMDQRYGLTLEERRDFRMLYGDPWLMVQNLLGHSSREVTVNHYLAPVADLQLRSMLATARDDEADRAPMPEQDVLFARVAAQSEGIQDIDDRLRPRDGQA
jgi:hypothetical protein